MLSATPSIGEVLVMELLKYFAMTMTSGHYSNHNKNVAEIYSIACIATVL